MESDTSRSKPAGRDAAGRWAAGNPGGPGRPRRAIERDYLAALAEACPPATWRRIVERAVADAEAGDHQARTWLARYLVGDGVTLGAIAVAEALGIDAKIEVDARAQTECAEAALDGWSVHARALALVAERG